MSKKRATGSWAGMSPAACTPSRVCCSPNEYLSMSCVVEWLVHALPNLAAAPRIRHAHCAPTLPVSRPIICPLPTPKLYLADAPVRFLIPEPARPIPANTSVLIVELYEAARIRLASTLPLHSTVVSHLPTNTSLCVFDVVHASSHNFLILTDSLHNYDMYRTQYTFSMHRGSARLLGQDP